VPEVDKPATAGRRSDRDRTARREYYRCGGARRGDGLNLALNIAAMLIAFIALIALVNGILSYAHTSLNRSLDTYSRP